MNDPELDHYIDAAARVLDLPIDEQWRFAIRSNLAVSLNFCRLVASFSLEDDSEPANTFSA